jgi:hypothetical protein
MQIVKRAYNGLLTYIHIVSAKKMKSFSSKGRALYRTNGQGGGMKHKISSFTNMTVKGCQDTTMHSVRMRVKTTTLPQVPGWLRTGPGGRHALPGPGRMCHRQWRL